MFPQCGESQSLSPLVSILFGVGLLLRVIVNFIWSEKRRGVLPVYAVEVAYISFVGLTSNSIFVQ